MKKLSISLLISVSALSLTACAPVSAEDQNNTPGFTYDVVTVSGDKFGCTFEDRGWEEATMSCTKLPTDAAVGEKDTKGFTREVVTVRGSQLDCIFEDRGWSEATMSCFPLDS